jgi:hypothetical protein
MIDDNSVSQRRASLAPLLDARGRRLFAARAARAVSDLVESEMGSIFLAWRIFVSMSIIRNIEIETMSIIRNIEIEMMSIIRNIEIEMRSGFQRAGNCSRRSDRRP